MIGIMNHPGRKPQELALDQLQFASGKRHHISFTPDQPRGPRERLKNLRVLT
jgi:hypothetical protein